MQKVSYQPYHLYRRGDVWIRDEFDNKANLENDQNVDIVKVDPIIMRTTLVGNGFNPFQQSERNSTDGTTYWSLYADQESAVDIGLYLNDLEDFIEETLEFFNGNPVHKLYDFPVNDNGISSSFFEFKLDAGVFGPGCLDVFITNGSKKTIDPSPRPSYEIINVYGNNVDVTEARMILGYEGYNYIFTDNTGFEMPDFAEDDLVVGGTGAIKGVLNSGLATRLWGRDRIETYLAIQAYSRKYNQHAMYCDNYSVPKAGPIIPNPVTGYTKVYGNVTDLLLAQSVFGFDGFIYIRTDEPGYIVPHYTSVDLIVGGSGAVNGVPDSMDAPRVGGDNREDTARALKAYSDMHQFYPAIRTPSTFLNTNPVNNMITIYGTGDDLISAQSIFGTTGIFKFIDTTSGYNFNDITKYDIVLGGYETLGGVSETVPCIRLWGNTHLETIQSMEGYHNIATNSKNTGYYGNFYKLELDKNSLVDRFYGPCSWQISDYHRLCPGQHIALYYACKLKTDPIPNCEIDNLVIYPYYEISCDVTNSSPMKTDDKPKKIDVLRGFNAFQSTSNINAYTEMTLIFYSEKDHTDFVSNCDKIHVYCDEKGVTYRGVLELSDCTYYGGELYEQKIKFYSSNKLGVGWC